MRIHLVPVLVDLVVGDAASAECFEAGGFGLDVDSVDVEVHAVLGRLWFGDPLEEELGSGAAVGEQDDVDVGLAERHVVERGCPEGGEERWVLAVEDESDRGAGVGHGGFAFQSVTGTTFTRSAPRVRFALTGARRVPIRGSRCRGGGP